MCTIFGSCPHCFGFACCTTWSCTTLLKQEPHATSEVVIIAMYYISFSSQSVFLLLFLFLVLRNGAATPNTVAYTWTDIRAKDAIAKGYKAVEVNLENFYLDYIMKERPPRQQWIDIAAGVKDKDMHLLLGGEAAMWTDNWCFVTQCTWQLHERRPIGKMMFDRSADDQFATSIQGMIWPRSAIAAGSFWNYQPSLKGDSVEFEAVVRRQAEWLVERGVGTCPPGCICDQVTHCGKKLPGV